jgi:predicted dehydrogenase
MSSEQRTTQIPKLPIQLGIIGTGSIFDMHVKGIAEQKEAFQIIALCDTSETQCNERIRQLNDLGLAASVKNFSEYNEMFTYYEAGGLDAVIVATPFKYHPEIVKAAAAKGVHVLVEKPFAASPQEGLHVLKAVAEAKIVAMVGHVQLHLPAVRKAKALVRGGEIGKVVEVVCRDCFIHPAKGMEGTWRIDARGGVILDTGIHPLSRLLFLADSLDATNTVGKGINRTGRLENGPDEVELFLELANGVTGRVLTSWSRPLESCGARIEVIGTEGILWSIKGYDDLYLQSFTPGSTVRHIDIEDNINPFITQMEVFANSLMNGKLLPPAHGIVEAQRILEIIRMSGVLEPYGWT